MNDLEQVPQAGTPAAPADAGETPVERLGPSTFAESSGNLPATANSSTSVARCLSATASGVVGTSRRDRR
jgi:hypothetical protein